MNEHAGDSDLTVHRGQCHCGLVQFEFRSSVSRAVRCNCSYCVRKAALHHRVTAENFALLAGENQLTAYRFGTLSASHYFCRCCGIHTHCNPRSAPQEVNVNLHCVEEGTALEPLIEISAYDGRSWRA